jgi:hypothetical protein
MIANFRNHNHDNPGNKSSYQAINNRHPVLPP